MAFVIFPDDETELKNMICKGCGWKETCVPDQIKLGSCMEDYAERAGKNAEMIMLEMKILGSQVRAEELKNRPKDYKPYRKERPADRFSGLDRHSAFEENGCTGF